jgi:2',3'-cyclic-nucleotide 2'-phosphodiesterase/3'-nucleotidase
MRAHLAAAGHIAPRAGPGWSFRPLPGTTALFDSAAGAVAPDAAIEPLGSAPGGFHRFRLHL